MARELRVEAISERRNLIINGTLNDPEKAEQLCRELKNSGYHVDVRALAVNEQVAQRGVAQRLENSLANPEDKVIPRDVPLHIQKEAYEGMPNAVSRIEHAGIADRVAVYGRRSTEPLYENSGSLPEAGQDAQAAILSERNREMTSAEKVEHTQGWDRITKMASRRGAPEEERLRYQQARAQAHAQLRRDPVASAEYDTQAAPPVRSLAQAGVTPKEGRSSWKDLPQQEPETEEHEQGIEHEHER